MKTEIETRFLDIDKVNLISKLNALNAENKGEFKLEEIIFYDKDLKWLDEKKLVKIRNNGTTTKLIFKNNSEKTLDGAKEIEFEIPNIEEAKLFLESIGLTAYRTVEKLRHSFILDGVTIDIDTWPKIPVYAELEGDSIEKIKEVAMKLEFDWDSRFDGDPRFVYKKYGFDFDNIKTVTFEKFE